MNDEIQNRESKSWNDFLQRWNEISKQLEEEYTRTPEAVVERFQFIIENKLYNDDTLTVAVALHDELVEQLKHITDPSERLAVAKQARETFEKGPGVAS